MQEDLPKMDQHNFSRLQNYITNFWLHNPNTAQLPYHGMMAFPFALLNNLTNQRPFLHTNNTNQFNLPINGHNQKQFNKLQGAGDGLHNNLISRNTSDLNFNNKRWNVSNLVPAESLQAAFSILPLQPKIPCKDRMKESINYYLEYQANLKIASESNRSTPDYNNINYFDFPHESSFPEYRLFRDFNFATPRKVSGFEQEKVISYEDFKTIRDDFARNGMIDEEYTKLHIFPGCGDSEENLSAVESTLIPMQHSNIDFTLLDNIKKRLKSQKEVSEDHCSYCKNNGEEKVIYESHTMKDFKGRVLCPRLRLIKCPICGADGDDAHLMKQCPEINVATKTPEKPSKRASMSIKREKKLRR